MRALLVALSVTDPASLRATLSAALGATAARTSVVPPNTSATRLYESLGFRLTGEEEHGELVMALDI